MKVKNSSNFIHSEMKIGSHLTQTLFLIVSVLLMLSLSGCLGGFTPRESVVLPDSYQQISITGIEQSHPLYREIRKALEGTGVVVTTPENAKSILEISQLSEEKQAVGYSRNREIRQYLIMLGFKYRVIKDSVEKGSVSGQVLLPQQSINLDKTQVYDSAYVLGKTDEEEIIRNSLRKDAARLIILRLQYGNRK